MLEWHIRLMVHPQSIHRPSCTSQLLDWFLSPAIRPPSRCSTNLPFFLTHVKFYIIKTQNSSKYIDSQKLGFGFLLLLCRPFYTEGRGITFSPPPLIESVPEFLVAQLLIFTTFCSSVCFDVDHFLDNSSCGLGQMMCFFGSPFLASFDFFRSSYSLRILNSLYFESLIISLGLESLLFFTSHGSFILNLSP